MFRRWRRDWQRFQQAANDENEKLNDVIDSIEFAPTIPRRSPLMATAGASPSSSPRLPSPPPFTEVQIGPKSPSNVTDGFGASGNEIMGGIPEPDDASICRIRPGTRAVDMASGPPLVPLSQVGLFTQNRGRVLFLLSSVLANATVA